VEEGEMAETQQPRGEGGAEFVRQIVTDPRNVPDVMRLYGYLGASSEDNHDRLYLNADLSQYVEVPTGAILHRMAVPAEQDPNGAAVLWVRRDAALVYKSAPAAQALASYFAGAIAGAAAAGPVPQPWAAQYVAGAIGGNTLYPHVCTPQCNTRYPYCGTVTPACTYPATVCGCRFPGAAAAAGVGAAPAAAMPLATGVAPFALCQPPTPACTHACPTALGATPCAPCHTPACTPLCLTHVLTLCAAGGVLCTPDCPTGRDICGHTPYCQTADVNYCTALGPYCGNSALCQF
jgi:hypothetical protein